MKTNTYLYKYLLAVVLSVGSLLTVQAQSTQPDQDALYIYRNDGGFNGFFYADIEKIEFSRIDLNGVEHDDYVVQEITALDSVYRIPISVIDSVAFVTPQTKYKEDVVTPSSDLWSYVVESDTLTTIVLSSSTPTALVPRVGDKLALTEARDYLPHGFYGKVVSLESVPKGYKVICKGTALTELFDEYVVKIAASNDNEGGSNARRRANYDTNSIDFDFPTLKQTLDLATTSWGPTQEFSISGEGLVSFSLKPKLNIRAFLAVSWWDGINFDITTRLETTTDFEVNLKGALNGSFDVGAPPAKFPLGTSPIFFEMEAGWNFAMSGSIEYNQKWRNVFSGYAMAQYNSIEEGNSQFAISYRCLENTNNTTAAGTISFSTGPYVEFNFTLGDKDIARVGTRFESGVKAEISADFKMDDLEQPMQYASTLLYDKLNRDGGIKMGPYGTGKLIGNVGNWSQEASFYDKMHEGHMLWDFEGGLVPDFRVFDVKYDTEKKIATAMSKPTRDLLVEGDVGFIIYDKYQKEVAKKWYWHGYRKSSVWNDLTIEFPDLKDGHYRAYPLFKLFGKEMQCSPYVDFYVGEQQLTVSKEKVIIPNAGGTDIVEVDNTINGDLQVEYGAGNNDWWSCVISGNKYVITLKKNETGVDRESYIRFSATDKNNPNTTDTKTVTIKQTDEEDLHGLVFKSFKQQAITHDPTGSDYVWVYVTYGEGKKQDLFESYAWVNVGLEDDILDLFKKNKNFEPDANGRFGVDKDGFTLNGAFDNYKPDEKPQTGSGTFTINTSYDYNLKTAEDVASWYRDGSHMQEKLNLMLNGTMRRHITGTFTIEWSNSDNAYVIMLKSSGQYQLNCVCYDGLSGMNVQTDEYGNFVDCNWSGSHPNARVIHTTDVNVSGTTDIDFQILYDFKE